MNPKKLKLKNFFSHEESEVDFDFDSCLLIGNTEGDYSKSNGSGKSSIFEALLWALFNKSRAPKMSDIVRWGETVAAVELEFEVDGVNYKVTRGRNNKNRTSSVTLQKESNGKWEDISGSTPSLTNSIIEETIKLDFKTFLNTTYFRQNDASEFAEAEPYRRKEILKSIVDITKWDKWENEAKSKIKDIKAEIKILESQVDEIANLESKVKSDREMLSEATRAVSKLQENLETEENSYILFLEEYVSLKNSLDFDSMGESERIIKENSSKISSLSSKQISLERSLEDMNSKKASFEGKISKISSFLEGKSIQSVSEDEISRLKESVTDLKSNIKFLTRELNSVVSKTMTNGTCEMCGNEVTEDHLKSFEAEKDQRIMAIETEILSSKDRLKFDLLSLKENEDIVSMNRKISDAIEKRSFSQERVFAINDDIERLSSDLKTTVEKIKSLDDEIEINKERLSSLKNSSFEECEEKLNKKKKLIDSIKSKLFDKKKEIGVHEANLKNHTERLDDLSKSKEGLGKKVKELDEYIYLKNVFGKNGIQTILLENIIKNHQAIANDVLKEICSEPIQIHMDTQKTSADGTRTIETLDLKIRKDGNILSYDSLSGGEKFRISIALALGLRDLAARFGGANLNLVMLDEVNSPLDRYGVETLFVNVIEKISKRYKTMVITHDERLKEKFENVIDVCKINGTSSINFSSFN